MKNIRKLHFILTEPLAILVYRLYIVAKGVICYANHILCYTIFNIFSPGKINGKSNMNSLNHEFLLENKKIRIIFNVIFFFET